MTQNEKIVWAAVFAQALVKEADSRPSVKVVLASIAATQAIRTLREVDPAFNEQIDKF